MDKIKVGDFFEGCSFHPCLVTHINYEDDDITGISLVDGQLFSCSISHCGVWKLTTNQAITSRLKGPLAIRKGNEKKELQAEMDYWETEEFKKAWPTIKPLNWWMNK